MELEDVKSNIVEFEGQDTMTSSSLNHYDEPEDIYPDAVLNISRDTASVFQLKRKWEKVPSMLNLTPDFQRDLVWSKKQKSELIESIVMGIPLPVFYVKENEAGVYIVVDGKQRLTSLFDFINDKFSLEGLRILRDYNGKKFSGLSALDQNKIEDCSLNLNVIKAPTSDRVTFDLFDRVNRGGTQLNHQEMRNALYQGTSTKLIEELASSRQFSKATEHSVSTNRMKDKYLMLRLLAFYMWQEGMTIDTETKERLEYKSNIEDFLGKTMSYINTLQYDSSEVAGLKTIMLDSLTRSAKYIVPLGGFRLPAKAGCKKRPINMALFECLGYFMAKSRLSSKDEIADVYFKLIENDDFLNALTYSIDSSRQIDKRYKIVGELLTEYL